MDARIEQIFYQEMSGDTSFQERESLATLIFGSRKYSKNEMRETWNRGIKLGIEIGIRKASVEGQKIELYHNITNPRHKEFVDKFYALAAEYQCAIQYNAFSGGMILIDRTNQT